MMPSNCSAQWSTSLHPTRWPSFPGSRNGGSSASSFRGFDAPQATERGGRSPPGIGKVSRAQGVGQGLAAETNSSSGAPVFSSRTPTGRSARAGIRSPEHRVEPPRGQRITANPCAPQA